MLPIVLIQSAVRRVLGWIDERTEAPIMKQRINEGSHRYFFNAQRTGELDEESGESTEEEETAVAEYARVRRQLMMWLFFLVLSLVYVAGFSGLGPLGRVLSFMKSQRFDIVIGAAIMAVGSLVQIVRTSVRMITLRREIHR